MNLFEEMIKEGYTNIIQYLDDHDIYHKNELVDVNGTKCPYHVVELIHYEGSFWECPLCGYKRNRWWDNPHNEYWEKSVSHLQ